MPFLPAGVGAAVAGGVASAAAGSLISGITGSNQSGAISEGQQQANTDLQPFVNTGTLANNQTANLLGLNGTDAANGAISTFQTSPGYDFTKTEGLKAIDAGAASKGMLRSGATLKAEDQYGTNLANQEFQQYITNLNGLAGLGQSSAAGQANVATGAAGQQASIYGNEGNALAKSVTGLASNPSVQNGLTSLFTGNGSGSGAGLGTSPDLYTGGGTF